MAKLDIRHWAAVSRVYRACRHSPQRDNVDALLSSIQAEFDHRVLFGAKKASKKAMKWNKLQEIACQLALQSRFNGSQQLRLLEIADWLNKATCPTLAYEQFLHDLANPVLHRLPTAASTPLTSFVYGPEQSSTITS
jgi:hypothetical protein